MDCPAFVATWEAVRGDTDNPPEKLNRVLEAVDELLSGLEGPGWSEAPNLFDAAAQLAAGCRRSPEFTTLEMAESLGAAAVVDD